MTSTDAHEAAQEAAKRNLWLHFTRMSAYEDSDVPVIVRGSGPYVFDQHGKKYLDGLSGLFVSQVGHGRTEIAEAGARQAAELAYFPLWSYAHPKAIELAARLADMARATSTGCSSRPAARKPSSRRGSWPSSTSS